MEVPMEEPFLRHRGPGEVSGQAMSYVNPGFGGIPDYPSVTMEVPHTQRHVYETMDGQKEKDLVPNPQPNSAEPQPEKPVDKKKASRTWRQAAGKTISHKSRQARRQLLWSIVSKDEIQAEQSREQSHEQEGGSLVNIEGSPDHEMKEKRMTAIAQRLVKEEQEEGNETEEQKQQRVRELPLRLDERLAVMIRMREKKEATLPEEDRRPSWFKRFKYNLAIAKKQLKNRMSDVSESFGLWYGHLKKIEGTFGSGVTSYFNFIRMLLMMNIPLFFILACFLVLPQLLHRYIFSGGVPGYPAAFCPESILTGECWLNKTELFQGAYYNGSTGVKNGAKYDMKQAFFWTSVAYYLLTYIVVMRNVVVSYRRNYVDASTVIESLLVTRIFSGWNFNITAKESVSLQHRTIRTYCQELLQGGRFKTREIQTCGQVCGVLARRLFIHFLVLCLLATSGYIAWYITEQQTLSTTDRRLNPLLVPLCLSAINFILPFAFSIIATFEAYKNPRTEVFMTMIRTMVLYGTTLTVATLFWLRTSSCPDRESQRFDRNVQDIEAECKQCWETYVGTKMYQLAVMDLLFTLFMTIVAEGVRKLLSRYCCKFIEPDFNIGWNTLTLIYSQLLCWLGTFFCPLMPLIMIIKLIIMFYVKRLSIFVTCKPSSKPWRGQRTHTLLQQLMVFGIMGSVMLVGYSVYAVRPSSDCGPFRGQEYMWDPIRDTVNEWRRSRTTRLILDLLTSTGFVGLLVVLLFVGVHYTRVALQGHELTVRELKKQLELEKEMKKQAITYKDLETSTVLTDTELTAQRTPGLYYQDGAHGGKDDIKDTDQVMHLSQPDIQPNKDDRGR